MADSIKIIFWPDVYKEQGHWLPTLAWAEYIHNTSWPLLPLLPQECPFRNRRQKRTMIALSKPACALFCVLFLSDKDVYRRAGKCPVVTYLVFQESLVWLLYILWQVRIEHKRWNLCVRQLRAILYLDILTLD